MQEYIIENESTSRMLFFLTVFCIMASLEYVIPKTPLFLSKIQRWANNFTLLFLDIVIIRVIFSTAVISMAVYTQENSIGLFYIFDIAFYLHCVVSIVLLDCVIYWQHRFFHTISFFWLFHKVHHSDMNYDVTTGFRFHPIELIFSMLIKISFIFILGVPVIAAIIFEILLNSLALFNHSNIKLPKRVDVILRYLIVTPDMHRIHHSVRSDELNSNFGFNISLWDRIFNSYKDKPKDTYEKMTIGLIDLQDKNKTVSLWSILKLPFIKDKFHKKQ